MTLRRRQVLKGAAAGSLLATGPFIRTGRAQDSIKIASIVDLSGGLDIYGRPMADALTMAVEETNAAGGLLGKPVEVVSFDAQSSIQRYTQYATEAATRHRVAAVHGGITSASREAIRPMLGRFQTLYFYNVQYEGGVCDRNVFCTGSTPAQTVEKLIPHVMNKWGKKVYIIAADYNYGQIIADWAEKYARDNGGEAVATEFFPLDVTDFGSTIRKIQAEKPDYVMSALVGGAHVSFYRQWAAAGMNKEIPLASTTFGVGNEHELISAEEGNGIIAAYSYFQEVDNPDNKAFVQRFKDRFGADAPYINELGARTYEGFNLWAEGVRVAGSAERMAVIEALETGVSFAGPSGKISIDPKTHHAVNNVYLAELRDQSFNVLESFPEQPPADTDLVCDLGANPNDASFYFAEGLEAAGIK